VNLSETSDDGEPVVKAAIGLIARDGRFLVRMRPEGTVYAGFWEFPGGKCEPGELPAQTVKRECLEETGLRVAVGRLRLRTRYRYPHGLVELHFYDCTPEDNSAEPAAETGFRWAPAVELATLRFPEANEAVVHALATDGSLL
jgi:8-oxo-dGTP diphosphatase